MADYPGTPGWDDNAATFEMSIVANNLHGDYQLANGYGHNRAKEVLEVNFFFFFFWKKKRVLFLLHSSLSLDNVKLV